MMDHPFGSASDLQERTAQLHNFFCALLLDLSRDHQGQSVLAQRLASPASYSFSSSPARALEYVQFLLSDFKSVLCSRALRSLNHHKHALTWATWQYQLDREHNLRPVAVHANPPTAALAHALSDSKGVTHARIVERLRLCGGPFVMFTNPHAIPLARVMTSILHEQDLPCCTTRSPDAMRTLLASGSSILSMTSIAKLVDILQTRSDMPYDQISQLRLFQRASAGLFGPWLWAEAWEKEPARAEQLGLPRTWYDRAACLDRQVRAYHMTHSVSSPLFAKHGLRTGQSYVYQEDIGSLYSDQLGSLAGAQVTMIDDEPCHHEMSYRYEMPAQN